ncbi:MAG: hypothetical protein V4508_05120 [Pseudomonadota bacterium]
MNRDTASGVVAQLARIVLCRDASASELRVWSAAVAQVASPAQGRAALANLLLALPEAAGLDVCTQLARRRAALASGAARIV